MKWRDTTSYSQSDKDRVPRSWDLEGWNSRLTVHRWMGIPDVWFLTAQGLGIERFQLGEDLAKSRTQAIAMVGLTIKKLSESFHKAVNA